mmetsp:Transcript_40837/g.102806  ORF Transcript_40837/g.102806 Transcript_40837/m.102806 type:complete len:139 (-) Transcript_40837:40-456(-)
MDPSVLREGPSDPSSKRDFPARDLVADLKNSPTCVLVETIIEAVSQLKSPLVSLVCQVSSSRAATLPPDLEPLCKALSQNKELRSLYLSFRHGCLETTQLQGLTDALGKNRGLTSLAVDLGHICKQTKTNTQTKQRSD